MPRDDARPRRAVRRGSERDGVSSTADGATPHRSGVTVDDVRKVAETLPRSTEVVVHGRIKFRVGSIVWLAFSGDGTEMGFAFPKDWREALVSSAPEKFKLPGPTDLRYNWAEARLEALDPDEMRDLVLEAWSMVVPKYIVDQYVRLERHSRPT
jgi:hypothetical protein